jgi:hypothetical protein
VGWNLHSSLSPRPPRRQQRRQWQRIGDISSGASDFPRQLMADAMIDRHSPDQVSLFPAAGQCDRF